MLSTPPAFILSQDQTLVKNVCIRVRIAWQFCSCLLFWFDIFRCPFLKNLFKEFSGFVVYCSVINVLFLLLPFHATAFILYQSVSCLSTTFLNYFLSLSIFISDNLYIISCVFCFVNTFFEVFIFIFKGYLTSLIINKNPSLFRDRFL